MARAPTAAAAAATQQGGKKKKGEKQQQQSSNAKPGELSKAQRKKAAKRAKKAAHASWCWYCDREFQDDKVLLSHQKSKHFRCPHCPRRLNTAGGLAVHIDQVHKVPTDRCVSSSRELELADAVCTGLRIRCRDETASILKSTEWRVYRRTT